MTATTRNAHPATIGHVAVLLLLFPVSLVAASTTTATGIPLGASIEAAVAASRALGHPTPLRLAPGLHFLNKTLALGPADAGLVIQGAGAASSALSGAAAVSSWRTSPRLAHAPNLTVWQTQLPPRFERVWRLFVADSTSTASDAGATADANNASVLPTFSTRTLARSPTMVYNHSSAVDPEHSIVYAPGQVLPAYADMSAVTATLYHCWTATTHRVRSITEANHTLTLYQAPHVNIPRCEHASGRRFFMANALELLDSPGEFYFANATKTLYYAPLPAEDADPTTLRAYAPDQNMIELVRGEGARDVRLQDLALLHAATDMDGFFEGDCDAQSASNLQTAAVHFTHSTNITLQNVTVAHTGGFAVWADVACDGVTMRGLHVHDVGAGAIRLGAAGDVPDVNATRNVVLADSWLHDGGHVYIHSPGVLLQYAETTTVTRNEIFDFYYSGVSMGWWPPDHNGGVKVSQNHLHHLGQGQLSDMACVYSLGVFVGGANSSTRVDNNICHNVSVYDYGGWGLYTDEHSANIDLTNNIIFDTECATVHEHYGTNITFTNNILVANSSLAPCNEGVIRSNPANSREPISFNVWTNVLYSSSDRHVFNNPLAYFSNVTFDSNVYFEVHTAVADFRFPGNQTLEEWQQHGASGAPEDVRSTVADPLFAATGGRYPYSVLEVNSPALARGFRQIDTAAVGPTWTP